MAEAVHRIEVAADAVLVEGELLDEACEEFERALESLRSSRLIWTTVDLSRVTAAAPGPIGVLFTVWLDLYRQGRAPFLRAGTHVWRMLGRAAAEHGLAGEAGRGESAPPRNGTIRSKEPDLRGTLPSRQAAPAGSAVGGSPSGRSA